jgi:hypothetical protein
MPRRLLELMRASRDLDLDGITITSPVLGVITYSLMEPPDTASWTS